VGVLRAAGADPVETVPLAAAAEWSACIDRSIRPISSRWSVLRHASRLRSNRVAWTSTSARGKPSLSTRGPEVPPMLLADSCSVSDSASASSASFFRMSAWSASMPMSCSPPKNTRAFGTATAAKVQTRKGLVVYLLGVFLFSPVRPLRRVDPRRRGRVTDKMHYGNTPNARQAFTSPLFWAFMLMCVLVGGVALGFVAMRRTSSAASAPSPHLKPMAMLEAMVAISAGVLLWMGFWDFIDVYLVPRQWWAKLCMVIIGASNLLALALTPTRTLHLTNPNPNPYSSPDPDLPLTTWLGHRRSARLHPDALSLRRAGTKG